MVSLVLTNIAFLLEKEVEEGRIIYLCVCLCAFVYVCVPWLKRIQLDAYLISHVIMIHGVHLHGDVMYLHGDVIQSQRLIEFIAFLGEWNLYQQRAQ